jgi:hypothetical protein
MHPRHRLPLDIRQVDKVLKAITAFSTITTNIIFRTATLRTEILQAIGLLIDVLLIHQINIHLVKLIVISGDFQLITVSL